jgi:ferric-dicitrate binding protein FerR (iron transport regulator)
LLAAAAIALLLSVGGLVQFIGNKKYFKQLSSATTVINTRDGERACVYLEDSTQIILNSGSKLQYSGDYNLKERKILLAEKPISM